MVKRAFLAWSISLLKGQSLRLQAEFTAFHITPALSPQTLTVLE